MPESRHRRLGRTPGPVQDLSCGRTLYPPIPRKPGEKWTVWTCPKKECKLRPRAKGTVITGTGRTGTSFLMTVLSDLGNEQIDDA